MSDVRSSHHLLAIDDAHNDCSRAKSVQFNDRFTGLARLILAMSIETDRKTRGTGFIPPPLSIETLAAWKNDPLPDHDALIARPWLLAAEKELANIDDEIKILDLRRSTLLTAVEVYRVALAPHKILPVDLIREIFICAVQDSSPEPFLNGLTSRDLVSLEIRLIICQVCSHWRRFSCHTTAYSALTTILLPIHSSQQPICRLAARICGLLETLELPTDDGPLPSMTAFARAPRLRSVTLRSVWNPINVEVCGIPWHQLTELYLDVMSPPPSQLWSILDGCNALGTAHLWMFQPDGLVPHVDRNIILPRLRTLALSGDDLTTYATFLHYIDLPSLEGLALLTEDRPSDIYFSVTTLPSVQRLSIDASGDAHDAPMVVPWLRACPSAVAVCLRHYLMSDPTLDEIANGTLLPNVEMLTIYYADPGTVISALQARQKSLHSTITETGVHADFYTELSMHNIDSLTELMMSGVFLCDSDFGGDPERGEIEQRARFEFETGSGVFERPSPPESDTPLP
ncbi:hypothetical protein C8R44DRAFT_740186 [Mycena epipterygia]|nr:hypothetical protein C8R44DRAFT_740186 [Mycena epipterygia]